MDIHLEETGDEVPVRSSLCQEGLPFLGALDLVELWDGPPDLERGVPCPWTWVSRSEEDFFWAHPPQLPQPPPSPALVPRLLRLLGCEGAQGPQD